MEEMNEINEKVIEEKAMDTIQEVSENQEKEQLDIEFTLSNENCMHLYSASKWCKFIAILGYIEVAGLIIAGLGFIAGAKLLATNAGGSAAVFKIVGFLYVIMAGICFFPISYLLRSAKKTQEAIELDDQDAIDEAFLYHKKFWKFLGIFTICSLALSILAIPIVIILTAMGL